MSFAGDHTSELEIVPFGDVAPDGFCAAVSAIGYAPRVHAGDAWLRQCAPARRSTALLLGDGVYPRSRILERLRAAPDPAVLSVFQRGCVNSADELVAACRDFLVWPCSSDELSVRLALMRPSAPADDGLSAEDAAQLAELQLIGSSASFLATVRSMKRLAASHAPVLVWGETGTGKEMAARAIHYLSPRRSCAFIPANCGALPDQLIENELFGHQRGAYTDAKETQLGLVEQAHGGTLFLDEIGNLSLKGQCALLRFLQSREFKRLGSQELRHADVRIVAATNANLPELVRAGSFREDLLYRLRILTVNVPALRDRPGDAMLLARNFLAALRRQYQGGPTRLSANSVEWLERYHWPGNVRELENLVHREFLLAEGPVIHIGQGVSWDVRAPARDAKPNVVSRFRLAKARVVRDFEREYLVELLERTQGNLSEAARLAGKERRGLARLLKKHGLDRAQFSGRS